MEFGRVFLFPRVVDKEESARFSLRTQTERAVLENATVDSTLSPLASRRPPPSFSPSARSPLPSPRWRRLLHPPRALCMRARGCLAPSSCALCMQPVSPLPSWCNDTRHTASWKGIIAEESRIIDCSISSTRSFCFSRDTTVFLFFSRDRTRVRALLGRSMVTKDRLFIREIPSNACNASMNRRRRLILGKDRYATRHIY